MQTYLKDLRWGRFNLIKGDFISEIASYYGEWSDVEVAVFHQLLSENASVVEVGSNIGMHTVPIAKAIPQGKLICFEPQRVIFQQLCCNLSLNNLTNVETYRLGVSDKADHFLIQSSDYDTPWNYGSFSLDHGFSTEGKFEGKCTQEEISVVALDNFKPIQQLTRLDLLKIDAEGFDINVLKGAEQSIKRFQPYIFIEVHTNSIDNTLAEIHRQGYEAYWIFSHRYQKDNFYGAERVEYGYDLNLLCCTAQHSTAQHSTAQHSQIYALFNTLVKAKSAEQFIKNEIPDLIKIKGS